MSLRVSTHRKLSIRDFVLFLCGSAWMLAMCFNLECNYYVLAFFSIGTVWDNTTSFLVLDSPIRDILIVLSMYLSKSTFYFPMQIYNL